MKSDICIVGAGPGGASAALYLAKNNIPVTLVDKQSFPRDKICGDALGPKVTGTLARIDYGLLEDFKKFSEKQLVKGFQFISPDYRVLTVPFVNEQYKDRGYTSSRIQFDNFLVDAVRHESKITFIEGVKLTEYKRVNGHLNLHNKSGKTSIDCKLVIIADGAQSVFARSIGKMKMERRYYAAGLRAYYKNISPGSSEDFLEFYYLNELLPGYLWIFPLGNGRFNVGLGLFGSVASKKGKSLKEILLQSIEQIPILKKRFENAELIAAIKGFGLPLGSKKRKISGDNYLLVGDAGSLIDPFTGEGIGNAMISGLIAAQVAETALNKDDFSSFYLQRYDRAVYQRLWKELKTSRQLQLLSSYPWLFNLVIRKAADNPALVRHITAMFFDIEFRENSVRRFYRRLPKKAMEYVSKKIIG